MDYKCIRRCFGFRKRMWERGDIAEDVSPEERIPYHFQSLSQLDSEPKIPEVVVNDPMKPIEVKPGERLKVKTGFGGSVPDKEVIPIKMVKPVKEEPKPRKRKPKKS